MAVPFRLTDTVRSSVFRSCVQVETELDSDLSIQRMAECVNLSASHFQRAFQEVMGETYSAHVRRRRLERAAWYLRNSGLPVNEIGRVCGFWTAAGFTKAFTRLFGMTPSDFRRSRPCREVSDHAAGMDDPLLQIPLTVTLENLPEFRVAFLRHVGPVQGAVELWNELLSQARRLNLLTAETRYFGLHHNDWQTPEAQSCYDAAITVPADCEPPPPFGVRTIPTGTCARVHVEGSLATLDRTWKLFAEEWLPASGYQYRLGYVFDEYPPELFEQSLWNRIRLTFSGLRADLVIPVEVMSPG